MKIFHLSDLHIGLKLLNRDFFEDQKFILNQIIQKAFSENPDAILIAGDIYDKAIPSAEAVNLFDSFISELKNLLPNCKIMIISGNHDSPSRINIFRNILRQENIFMIGLPPQNQNQFIEKVTIEDEFGKVNFYLLPFVKPTMIKEIVGCDENGNNLSYNESIRRLILRENINQNERNIIVSHQFYIPFGENAENIERSDSEIVSVGNIDAVNSDILNIFDYAALGHIHKPMKLGSENIRYCGTPLACSVSEANQQKNIIMLELFEKNNSKITPIFLEPLRKIKVIIGTSEEVLMQACDDYAKIVLTDTVDTDVIEVQDKIRNSFPNLLEISRKSFFTANYQSDINFEEELDVFQLCKNFLGDLNDDELKILSNVINSVQEGNYETN